MVRVILGAKGLTAKDIHKEMFPVYGEKCLSRKAVYNWIENFSQGRSKLMDKGRTGRSVQIATNTTPRRVQEVIQADKQVTVDSIATLFTINRKHFLMNILNR